MGLVVISLNVYTNFSLSLCVIVFHVTRAEGEREKNFVLWVTVI